MSDCFIAAILAQAMIYRARTLVTMAGPPVNDGAVAIDGALIADAGRFDEVRLRNSGDVVDLGEVALLPGLINAHCHLDYTLLRGAIAPQRSFANWIRRINGMRRSLSDDDFLGSIARGFAEARKWGTTTIANIESLPQLLTRMPSPPLRTWWFLELIDVRSRVTAEELVTDAIFVSSQKSAWFGGFGLSPHATYTASPQLSRIAAAVAGRNKMRLTMHLAESAEETEMFRDGRGPLFDLLQSLGRPMDDCGKGRTPLAVMLNRQTLDEHWIAVHLNELAEEDFTRLERGPRFHIAHCPGSGRYFQHRPFAMRRLRELGFNICLGTDSLASNSSLSLFAEMRAVRETHPWLAPGEILEMATVNGARALNQGHALGKIGAGFFADLIALPVDGNGSDLFENIIAWREPVSWMLIAGVPLRWSS